MTAPVLGMDLGGSSSRARLCVDGRAHDAEGAGANIATLDPSVLEERVSALVRAVVGPQPAACCAGAAGAEVPSARERLAAMLGRLLPGAHVEVVHDTRLVLAAAGLDAGVALVAGTGSVAYGRAEDGRETQRGGWGWLLGDEGGGVWITREAARTVVARAERGARLGSLGETLLAAAGAADARELVARLHELGEPARWAALAATVFASARADAGAMAIVDRAADALVSLAREVRESLAVESPVVLAGGLLVHQPLLEAAVTQRLGVPYLRLEQPPVAGAVRLAEERLRR